MDKIAVDARMINSSGIGTVIQNVLKRIIELRKNTLFYILGSDETLLKYPFLHNERVRYIDCKAPIYSISEQFEMIKKIPNDTNLLWIPHYNIPIFYSGKLLVTMHDVFHLAMPQYVKGIHKKLYAHFMFSEAVKRASHIICVSNFTKNELQKYVSKCEEKVTVVYNGIDCDDYKINYNVGRMYLKPYILFVGNVKPHKNIRSLIRAFQLIKEEIPHDLVIVGKKDGFITGDEQVARMASELGKKIFFTGYISDDELKNYYSYADLFVFPSYYEGFGLPPLESMAAGCSNIVCSDIPVLREIYGDYVTYFNLYDINDLAAKIIENLQKPPKVNTKPMLNGKSWDRTVSGYLKVIDDILKD